MICELNIYSNRFYFLPAHPTDKPKLLHRLCHRFWIIMIAASLLISPPCFVTLQGVLPILRPFCPTKIHTQDSWSMPPIWWSKTVQVPSRLHIAWMRVTSSWPHGQQWVSMSYQQMIREFCIEISCLVFWKIKILTWTIIKNLEDLLFS